MPFQPGQSGNPAGRPPGARNKVNRSMEPVFQANGEAIIERLVEHAKAANSVALRLCVDRLVPLGKHRQVGFQLPPMEKSDDVRAAIATIHAGVADGDISSGEAVDLLRVADISARMLREAEAAPSGVERELARHQRALAQVAAMLGCSPETLLGPADEYEPMAGAEEAPPIVNNDAETMAEAAAEAAAPDAEADAAPSDAVPSDAAPAARADAEVQASAARENEVPIVNNNAETMAPADPPPPALPDLVGSNENTPDAIEEPLRAASG
jgi:hypothetical protein